MPHGSQDPKSQDARVYTCCALVLQDFRIEPCVFGSIEQHETRVEPACSSLKSIPFDAYDYHLAETLQPWEAFLTAKFFPCHSFLMFALCPTLDCLLFSSSARRVRLWYEGRGIILKPWLERSGEERGFSKVRGRKETQEGNTELQNLSTSLRSAFRCRAGINMYTCNVSALGGRDRRIL